jgi:hypothetical protein
VRRPGEVLSLSKGGWLFQTTEAKKVSGFAKKLLAPFGGLGFDQRPSRIRGCFEQDESPVRGGCGGAGKQLKKVRSHSSGAVFFDSLVSGSFPF